MGTRGCLGSIGPGHFVQEPVLGSAQALLVLLPKQRITVSTRFRLATRTAQVLLAVVGTVNPAPHPIRQLSKQQLWHGGLTVREASCLICRLDPVDVVGVSRRKEQTRPEGEANNPDKFESSLSGCARGTSPKANLLWITLGLRATLYNNKINT